MKNKTTTTTRKTTTRKGAIVTAAAVLPTPEATPVVNPMLVVGAILAATYAKAKGVVAGTFLCEVTAVNTDGNVLNVVYYFTDPKQSVFGGNPNDSLALTGTEWKDVRFDAALTELRIATLEETVIYLTAKNAFVTLHPKQAVKHGLAAAPVAAAVPEVAPAA